jgi:hypothetical protein
MPSESEPFQRALVQLWVKWIDEHVATKIFFKVRACLCAFCACLAMLRCPWLGFGFEHCLPAVPFAI